MTLTIDQITDLDIEWTPKTVIVRTKRITPLLKATVVDKVVQVKHIQSIQSKHHALLEAIRQIRQ